MLKINFGKKKNFLTQDFRALKSRKSIKSTIKFDMRSKWVNMCRKCEISKFSINFSEKSGFCSARMYDQIMSNHNTYLAIKH